MAESSSASPKPAETRRSLDAPPLSLSEELQCSICLDVFTDPVSTPCGHNFCKSCLNQCWDNSQIYKCPLCKDPFSKRPDLKINTTLREVVLLFKGNSGQSKSEVLCDICDDIKMKALKMCLECQISYCQTHLEPHQRVPNLKKHKLIDPVEKLEDYICQKHEKPLELFCRDDQTCVCLNCAMNDHKNHNTVSVEEESRERKPQLMKMQADVQQMIQDRMKRIEDLKYSEELRKETSEKEKAESIELFTDLIRSIERCQSELLEMMEQKQKAAEKQAEELIKDLEQEITELKRRDTELEQLSHTEDHLHLLQIYPSLSRPAHTSSCSEISLSDTHESVETMKKAWIQLKETLNEKLSKTSRGIDEKLNKTVKKTMQQYAVKTAQPKSNIKKSRVESSTKTNPDLDDVGGIKTWQDFYSLTPGLPTDVDVTLDPDTSHPHLFLSDDRKQVEYRDTKLELPDNPERFDYCPCVLAKERFSSGRFYFEVQVKGKTDWDLGVVRESINRKGMITAAPEAGYWIIVLSNDNQYLALESPPATLSLRVKPQVVGVFVDYEEGKVSFHDVESRAVIHSFTGQSFTEKLYPYFSPNIKKEGRNVAPLIIRSVNECTSQI